MGLLIKYFYLRDNLISCFLRWKKKYSLQYSQDHIDRIEKSRNKDRLRWNDQAKLSEVVNLNLRTIFKEKITLWLQIYSARLCIPREKCVFWWMCMSGTNRKCFLYASMRVDISLTWNLSVGYGWSINFIFAQR